MVSADGPSLHKPLASAPNAASALTTPTYDGSGQVVEPFVWHPASPWNGHAYWMSVTPYPGSNSALENPSILVSSDGATWTVPSGVTNPIVAQPGSSPNANSDTSLMLGQDGVLYLYFVQVISSVWSVNVISSSDGVTWSSKTQLFTSSTVDFNSPCVVWDGSQYVMWYTDYSGGGTTGHLLRRTSSSPSSGWSAPTTVTINGSPPGYTPDECNVYRPSSGDIHMVLTYINPDSSIVRPYFLLSTDGGLTFVCSYDPIMGVSGGWDSTLVYRASISPTANPQVYDYWYSALGGAGWHMGHTTMTWSPPS